MRQECQIPSNCAPLSRPIMTPSGRVGIAQQSDENVPPLVQRREGVARPELRLPLAPERPTLLRASSALRRALSGRCIASREAGKAPACAWSWKDAVSATRRFESSRPSQLILLRFPLIPQEYLSSVSVGRFYSHFELARGLAKAFERRRELNCCHAG